MAASFNRVCPSLEVLEDRNLLSGMTALHLPHHTHFETLDGAIRVRATARAPEEGPPTIRLSEVVEFPPSPITPGLPDHFASAILRSRSSSAPRPRSTGPFTYAPASRSRSTKPPNTRQTRSRPMGRWRSTSTKPSNSRQTRSRRPGDGRRRSGVQPVFRRRRDGRQLVDHHDERRRTRRWDHMSAISESVQGGREDFALPEALERILRSGSRAAGPDSVPAPADGSSRRSSRPAGARP